MNETATAQTSTTAEPVSRVSPLACLHTMLQYNTAGSPGPTQGRMPTLLPTNPQQLLFSDENGAIYTIEWPHLYKLKVDPKAAKPGSVLITDMRKDHKLNHTSPTSVWQFVTPKGVPLTIHSAFQDGKQVFGVRARDADLANIDGLIQADKGMKTANEAALQKYSCDDGHLSLSENIADLAAPVTKVSLGREMSMAEAKKDLNEFNKQNAKEQIAKYSTSLAEREQWKKDLEQTKTIAPQPNSAVELQPQDVEKQLASDMIPALKSKLDGTIISKQAVADITKYCGPEMIPKERPLTDSQKAKNLAIDSLNNGISQGAANPFLDALKESNAPK